MNRFHSTITVFLLISLPIIGFGQVYDLNAYKYVVINQDQDPFDIGSTVSQELKSYGVKSLMSRGKMPIDFINCQALYCQIIYTASETFSQIVILKFTDCDGNLISESQSGCAVCAATVAGELRKASKKAIRKLDLNYKYNPEILKHTLPDIEFTNETESSLTSYYDSNILNDIEGIYKSVEENGNSYTLGIKKYGRLFKAIIIKADYGNWKEGEVKIILNQTATKGVYSCSYFMGNKQKKELFLIVESSGLLTFKFDDTNEAIFIKMYPLNTSVNSGISSGEWNGNGSGFFISENGYIVTNYHVIEMASEIEVEFKYNNEIIGLNARVIQTDATNDLAILKIDDDKFSNTDSLPYNFRTRSVDVGTDVFALGYPKALTIMGKEIKFTDGRISSKTGFKGDITSYQSTTPIQPGNSGGPLFDFNGNLIGVNNSKIISKDVEGVSYSIKSSYLLNLIDVLPESIALPSNTSLSGKPLTEQIKVLSDYVVLIKVK